MKIKYQLFASMRILDQSFYTCDNVLPIIHMLEDFLYQFDMFKNFHMCHMDNLIPIFFNFVRVCLMSILLESNCLI